jgi:ketosteroid isomerase-like protein
LTTTIISPATHAPMPYRLLLLLALLFAPPAFAQDLPTTATVSVTAYPVECRAATGDADARNLAFLDFLDHLDAGLTEFVNGDPNAFASAWAHSADVTVAGGFGGPVVRGWDTLAPRLGRISGTYTDTEFTTERIIAHATSELAFVVQHERFLRPGAEHPYQEYRVTMIFRCEGGPWKLIHRHADAQMEFVPRD